ncbi:MAG: hypothetical protein ACREQV_01415 [Candidatus Binatia bacterium]
MLIASIFLSSILLGVTAGAAEASECRYSDRNDLWMAKTSGIWEAGERYGYFRVLVFRKIGDAAMDTVCVETLSVDESSQNLTVLRTDRLESPGYAGNVSDIHFFGSVKGGMAVGLDIQMRGMNNIVLRDVFVVYSNASPRRIVAAKFVDVGQ